MKYLYRVDLPDSRRMGRERRHTLMAVSTGEIDLPVEPKTGQTVSPNSIMGQLRIKNIENNANSPQTLVLDGSSLGF